MIYLLDIVTVMMPWGAERRVPKYFGDGTISANYNLMDYGFFNAGLVYSGDISEADKLFLEQQPDVFVFPTNLDTPVTDPNIDQFFEALNLPTDWLTPATTYRELLRQVAGMMQFNQAYGGISGGHSIFENATMDTRLRQMTAQEQAWFLATVDWFSAQFNLSIDSSQINTNSQLRLLVRQAGTFWEGQTFIFGGMNF